MNIEDYILIRRIQNGDPEAFETLVRKYYQNIYQFCVRRCNGDTALAADMTQDTFLKLIEHIQQYRLTGKFMNFLLTIAVNTCNNHFKKKSPDIVDMDTLSAVPSNLNISEEVLRQEDAIIGTIDLIIILAITLFTSLQTELPMWEMALYLFVPFNLACIIRLQKWF